MSQGTASRVHSLSTRRTPLISAVAVFVGLLVVPAVSVVSTSQAATTPTVEIIAGTGTAGFSGDNGPAASAQLSGPASITTDSAGNVYVTDAGNLRIRRIDTAGTIQTVVGDGTSCRPITDVTQPVLGLCPDSGYGYGGLSSAQDGTLYYRDSVGISHATPLGGAFRYAGKITGLATYGDGPKFDVTVDPHDVAYDATTGNVYFIDNHAVRAVTPAGQVTTVAGTTADCNAPSDDTASAVGACLWPKHLAAQGGRVYFTEQSSWNGPRARYVDGNSLHTVAGDGTWTEPTLGVQATSSGFPDMGGIAVDSLGNIYLSGLSRGRIWQVSAAVNSLSLVTEFQGSAGWLAVDATGKLFVSLPYTQQIARISGLSSPPPPISSSTRYVAMGDSYSSGEGSFDYYPDSSDPATFNTCHRSPHAYGPLLDTDRGLGAFTFSACSGAVTNDVIAANHDNANEPAQIGRGLGATTTVVTLTLGGNDANFPHVITKCVNGARPPGTGDADQGAFGCSRNTALRRDIDARLAALDGRPTDALLVGPPISSLSDIYKKIAKTAPNATIYVGGYPRLFGVGGKNYQHFAGAPSGSACFVGFTSKFGLPLFYFVDYLDALWLDVQATRLDGVIRHQVAVAQAAGVKIAFVAPLLFTDHGLCDRSDAWINPIDFTSKPSVAPSSFHPSVVGQHLGYESAFLSRVSG